MAVALIEQLSAKFDISQYRDNYSGELLRIIKAKAKGVKLKEPELKIVHKKGKDLMDQLKASIGTKRKKVS